MQYHQNIGACTLYLNRPRFFLNVHTPRVLIITMSYLLVVYLKYHLNIKIEKQSIQMLENMDEGFLLIYSMSCRVVML
jgi:hypothetical protein